MIQIDELKYRYSDSAVWALRDTSLSVGNGELIVLTGKSGCGKSTLFRCINGLCPNFFEGEKAGGVFLMGKEISLMRIGDISKMAASVFQNPESQFFTTDVLSDLVFACENYGISKENIQACMDSVVALLSLEPLLGRKLAELSGGEKQKVAIASALMLNADILLMDEPSSNLDYQSIRLLKDTLAGLKAEGYTIMVIEHRLYYLKDICDRLIVLENGEIVRTYEREALTVSDNNAFHEQGLRGVHLFQNAVRGSHAQNAPNPLLALEGIRFGYQKGTDILQGIDLCVYPGDRIALLGKNGCGKTTMGKILCGLKKERCGSILLNGAPIPSGRRSRAVSYVMQNVDFQLFGCSVFDDLLLGNEKLPDIEPRAHGVLSELGLSEQEKQHPTTLSMGQKQRLVIAAAYLLNKRVNIFDEPTSGLDYDSMMSVCDLIISVTGRENASIVITHDYEFILSACNRVVLLEDGIITEDFPLDNPERLEKIFQNHL